MKDAIKETSKNESSDAKLGQERLSPYSFSSGRGTRPKSEAPRPTEESLEESDKNIPSLILTDEGRIQSVNFIGNASKQPVNPINNVSNMNFSSHDFSPFFYSGAAWENVPSGFVVITGSNGTGKSQLLKYIKQNLERSRSNDVKKIKFIYIGPEYHFKLLQSIGNIDTSFFVEDRKRYEEIIDTVLSQFTASKKDISQDKKELVEACLDKLSSFSSEEITKEFVGKTIDSVINYEFDKMMLDDPLSILRYVIFHYDHRRFAIKKRAESVREIFEVYRLFCGIDSDKREKILADASISNERNDLNDLAWFMEQISENSNFYEAVLDAYAEKRIGTSPLNDINKILKDYGFRYELRVERIDRTNGSEYPSSVINLTLILTDGEAKVEYHQLSSGETMMLSLLAWLYRANMTSGEDPTNPTKEENKIKIMLLDEPDRHLDPRLCKLFSEVIRKEFVEKHRIQVLIVTHRMDTVALAPDDNIYIIDNKKRKTDIINAHKMRAIFRMSGNYRDFSGYHSKVYVESRNDARFYEAVYDQLLTLSRELRHGESLFREKSYDFNFGKERKRILSDRYQMSFYGCSHLGDSGAGGGCKQVSIALMQEKYGLRAISSGSKEGIGFWHKTRRLCSEPRFYQSYGVLDKDNDIKEELIKDVEDQVVLTKRHSLDNYLFDPVVFCWILTEEELENCIGNSYLNSSKCTLDDKQTLLNTINKSCLKIKRCLLNENKEGLQENLETYFSILLRSVANQLQKSQDKNEEKLKAFLTKISEKIDNNLSFCDTDMTMIESKDNSFTLRYPSEFLEIQGHLIEEIVFKNSKIRGVKPSIAVIDGVFRSGLKLIPLDLADIFFELNERVRENANNIIKPEEGQEQSRKRQCQREDAASSSSSMSLPGPSFDHT